VTLEAQRDAELAGNEKLRKILQTKIALGKHRKSPVIVVPKANRLAMSAPSQMCERTLKQLHDYKTGGEPARLDVKIASIESLIKMTQNGGAAEARRV